MGMRFRGNGFGLTIDSDFVIPGATDRASVSGSPDLTIVRGATGLNGDAESVPPYRRLDGKLELIVPSVASYVLEASDLLAVIPEAGASSEDVSALLIASAIPMALWARGGLVLHASGVIRSGDNRAIAIVGASGSGKSTIARELVTRGGKLVGDDSLWLREEQDGISASGLPGGLFAPGHAGVERAFWPVAANAQCASAQLGGIVILDPSLPSAQPQQLHGAAALAAVLRHRHRPRIPFLLGLEAERLAVSALLCARVPVYALGGEPAAITARLEQICGLPVADL